AQAEAAPEDAEHTPRPASVRAPAARRAPVQIEEPDSGRADDCVRRRHEEEDAPAEGATCGRHQRASWTDPALICFGGRPDPRRFLVLSRRCGPFASSTPVAVPVLDACGGLCV